MAQHNFTLTQRLDLSFFDKLDKISYDDRPEYKDIYVFLREKSTDKVVDICKINYKQTETMSQRVFFMYVMTSFFNPFNRGEESFISLMQPNKGKKYDVKHASRLYDLERRHSLF